MTLASPTLISPTIKRIIHVSTAIDHKYRDFSSALFWEIINWTFYILIPIIWVLFHCGATFLMDFLFVPKYAWDFFWHKDGRSIFDMLCDPERKHEPEGNRPPRQTKNSMRTDSRRRRRLWKRLKHDTSYRDVRTSLVNKGPPGKIRGYDSKLCLFSFYQLDRNNMNKCENGSGRRGDNSNADAIETAMAFTEYFASTYCSAAKIFWLKRPAEPPDGHILSFLVLVATISIYFSITVAAAIRLSKTKQSPSTKSKKNRRRVRKRSTLSTAKSKYRSSIYNSRRLYFCLRDFKDGSWESFRKGLYEFHNPPFFDANDSQDIFHDSCECHHPEGSEGEPEAVIDTLQAGNHAQDSKGEPQMALDTSRKSDCPQAFEGEPKSARHINVFTTSLADVDLETLNTQVPFDTDSIFFVCDNSTTGHICNDISKFIPGSICNTDRRLTTANGNSSCVQEGTARIHLTDDNGTRHTFVLDNCIYLPDSPVSLLSTRRLAEKFLDNDGNPDEDTNITSRYSTHVLTWCHGKYQRTFPTPVSGLPELLFDEGFKNFSSYCTEIGSPVPTYSFLGAETITTSDEDSSNEKHQLYMRDETIRFKDGNGAFEHATYIEPVKVGDSVKHKILRDDEKEYIVERIFISPLSQPEFSGVPISIEEYAAQIPNLTKEQLHEIAHPTILDDAQRELMQLHCKLNHMPFPALIVMAEKGQIKKSLAKLKERVPICMSCTFGMSHRRPWRTKGTPGSIRKEDETEPGDCVSMDQLVSAQPGLIPQMSGFLTNMRIWGSTVFVDHVSDYVYVALMRNLTLDETLLAKTSFERHAQNGGVRIKAYRADNGRFADQGFRDALNECNQKITFCAVGAHHQNGIVERRIKELTLIARTLLLHAVRHWPGFITTMLWPFALKEAAYRLNKLMLDENGLSAEARFFGSHIGTVDPSLFHTFGSPCFPLDARLQSGVAGAPKWEPRARLGIYVGHSPSHAGSVALVLNPKTGHVSPQFHVVFDDSFTTVPFMDRGETPPNWAELVEHSRELVTEDRCELAETWLNQHNDSGTSDSPDPIMTPTTSPNSSPSNETSAPHSSHSHEASAPNSSHPHETSASNSSHSHEASASNSGHPHETSVLNSSHSHETSAPPSSYSRETSAPNSVRSHETSSPHLSHSHETLEIQNLDHEASPHQQQVPGHQTFHVPVTQDSVEDSNNQQSVRFDLTEQASDAQIFPACEGDALRNTLPQMINLETSGLRRSSRIRAQSGPSITAYTTKTRSRNRLHSKNLKQPRLAFLSLLTGVGRLWSFASVSSPHCDNIGRCHSFVARVSNEYERVNGLFDDTINNMLHHVKAFTTGNENFTFNQMLKEDDYRMFFQAMLEEISVHEEREHWTLMNRRDMPSDAKTIMAIWSFKRKRYPDGSLNKHKARLCAHGGQQTWGQDYWDTYAPVVTWASVRLLLIVAKIHKLESKSIDFVLAFPQANLDVPVYMELPAGVVPADDIDENRRRYVLRLNKSLYGLKQAGHNWFEKLRTGLTDRNFVQSQVDKCVFYRDGCIVLTYVDDCILLGHSIQLIDSVINSLQNGEEDFELTDEGSIDKYLGVLFRDIDESSFEMSQPFLARRILEFLSLSENTTKSRNTPVGKPLLNKDLNGVPRKHTFLYRGAVGMLSYYCNSVRPEIQMAVHQTARFSINPMRSHELAIMRIGRYLVDTCDKGIIYNVEKSKGLEVYVDADFAGTWAAADANNADSVLS